MPKQRLELYRREVESFLEQCLDARRMPATLYESMRYSLLAGGKRVRPVLCLVWAELLGGDRQAVLPFASGLECIHTYSLVHDDLPAMDDDDLRRGKPSNHKQFGEAMAILAGDGLLTHAFELMLHADLPAERLVRAAGLVAGAAGASGMIGGQVTDIQLTGSGATNVEDLRAMHGMKTGALLQVACTSGAVLAGAIEEDIQRAATYGGALGLAFQVADDILDVVGDEAALGKPVGSDQGADKVTYPALMGLDKSKSLGQEMVAQAQEALQGKSGPQADFLSDLVQYVMDRTE